MAKRAAIIEATDRYLKASTFTDYAPVGLQVEGAAAVKKVTTGVSISMELLDAAVEGKSEMVLVHHGLFWKGQSPVLKGSLKQRVAFMLENDLTLAAYHLPLDAHRQVGNNAQLIKMLGAGIEEPFGDYHGTFIGYTGLFKRALKADKITARFEPLAPEGVAYFPGRDQPIKRIAVVSGGAGDLFEQAIEQGNIDLYITGEPWEPAQALARESGVGFMALGHYNSEKPGVIALGGWLKRRFKVAVDFVDIPNRA